MGVFKGNSIYKTGANGGGGGEESAIIYDVDTKGLPPNQYYNWEWPNPETVYNKLKNGEIVLLRIVYPNSSYHDYFYCDNGYTGDYDPQFEFNGLKNNRYIRVGFHTEDNIWYFSIDPLWSNGVSPNRLLTAVQYGSYYNGSIYGLNPSLLQALVLNNYVVKIILTVSSTKYYFDLVDSTYNEFYFKTAGDVQRQIRIVQDPNTEQWSIEYTP